LALAVGIGIGIGAGNGMGIGIDGRQHGLAGAPPKPPCGMKMARILGGTLPKPPRPPPRAPKPRPGDTSGAAGTIAVVT